MDESIQRNLEQPQVGTLKLSEAVRQFGYKCWSDPEACVLGTALKAVYPGHRHTCHPAMNYRERAASLFGVPLEVCKQAEMMCADNKSARKIADWLSAQGY